MIVNVKHLGKRKNSIDEIPFQLHSNPKTIGELIEETVKICVKQYKSRKEKQEVLEALSQSDIKDMAAGGKVSFAMNYGNGIPDIQKAIDNAKQAFMDGIVVIFINGVEKQNIEDEVDINEHTKVTFVRMTMLSGRMW